MHRKASEVSKLRRVLSRYNSNSDVLQGSSTCGTDTHHSNGTRCKRTDGAKASQAPAWPSATAEFIDEAC